MNIDLEKNKTHILEVHNDVLNDKSPTNWALFGYEGQTNVLKVVGWGDEGVEELSEELNASKIMYGVLRIEDPKTSRTKIVLLNWGESAPNLRKGVCARHLPDVKRMLKGVHITVSARTEEDVDSDAIIDSVVKATSTEYNFKDRSELPDKNVPVKNIVKKFWSGDVYGALGTNYKRTNPQVEINSNTRNKFWEEQEAEERIRKEEEIKKRGEEQKRLEKERIDRELQDSKHRDELNRERNARILADKKAELSAVENTKKFALGAGKEVDTGSGGSGPQIWKKKEEDQLREEEEVERAKRADQMRLQRKKEAESLIGHKTHETRSIFESQNQVLEMKSSLSKPPPRKLKEFNLVNTDENYSLRRENSPPRKSVGARWPPPSQEEEKESLKAVPGKITEWKPAEVEINTHVEPRIVNSFQNEALSNVSPSSRYEVASSESRRNDLTQLNTASYSSSSHFTHPTSSITTSATSSSITVVSSAPSSSPSSTPPSTAISASPKKTPYLSDGGVEFSPDLRNGASNDEFVRNGVGRGDEEGSSAHRTNGRVPDFDDQGTGIPSYAEELDDDFASVCMTYEVDGVEYQILPEHGLCARALYDYQAADDTEITFDPGDIITNIEQIDVGWWQGLSSLGVFGLFPANYVELINGTKIH